MTAPPEREGGRPEATRAENEPRSRRDLLVVALVVVLVIGTIVVVQRSRSRRALRTGATPEVVNDPTALGLPPMAVAIEIQIVANRIRGAWRRDGAPPMSLERLPPDEDDPPPYPDSPSRRDPPLDLWGRPYRLDRAVTDGNTVLTLTTYGSDGDPGGEGSEQDVSMEIAAPSE